ncbi:MAG: SDR family NAD(P)-dependent oxidoreductase [Acidimicrobiales bacterium]
MRLAGRVALITGAGSGIGRATAELFAAEGAAGVVLVDVDPDGLAATAAAIERAGGDGTVDEDGPRAATGGRVMTVAADVTDEDIPAATVAATLDRFGHLDVVVTAAGISRGRSIVDTDPDVWHRVLAVNLTGTYLWLRAALPPMLERGRGSAITVSSQLAVSGGRANAAYIASKGAILSLTRTTALDCAGRGVRVNTILPGATETPLMERGFAELDNPESALAWSRRRHPLRRFGRPDEIANAALYLASDESSFVTGTELRVDGGWTAG